MNVLFIDDEQPMHPVMSSLLQNYGERNRESVRLNGLIDPAQGLFEATNHGHKYDLILLDMRLPSLTGAEIYRKTVATHPQLLNRILFITGYREEIDTCLPDHDLHILEKPFRYEQLEEKILAMMT